MSIRIMSAVWEHAPVEGGKLLVLLALADHANDNGICWPSRRKLAEKARLSESQVKRVLTELERAKLIVRELRTGPFHTNTYKVLVQGGANCAQGASSAQGGAPTRPQGGAPTRPKPSTKPSTIESSSALGTYPLRGKELTDNVTNVVQSRASDGKPDTAASIRAEIERLDALEGAPSSGLRPGDGSLVRYAVEELGLAVSGRSR